MRKIFAIFLSFISCAGFAQQTNLISKNTRSGSVKVISVIDTNNKHNVIIHLDGPRTFADPAYYINGKISKGIGNLNPDDIFTFSVLKGSQDTVIYGPKAKNGVIVVTTKAFAKKHNLKN